MSTPRGSLRTAVEDFINSLRIGERVSAGVTQFIENVEHEALELHNELSAEMGTDKVLPAILQGKTSPVLKKKRPALLVVFVGLIFGQVWGIITGATEPFARIVRYRANSALRNIIPDLPLLIQIYRVFPHLRPRVIEQSQQQGYSDQTFLDIEAATQRRLNEAELLSLYRRGLMDEQTLRTELTKLGWNPDHVGRFLQLSQLIPPVSDLIAMAVRDAFNEQTVARFRYDEGFPSNILPFTKAQGLSDDFVRRYWRAHWNLPSPQQAFEMFQRLRPGKTSAPFTFDDLQTYLVTADIPAFFRDRLTQIAYNPLTRVDVRRMHDFGILSEREVYESYLDIGYSPQNAQHLAEFTVVYNEGDTAELSRSAIVDAYKKGIFSAAEAIQQLTVVLGNAELAVFWMEMANYDLALDQQEAQIDNLKVRYVEGVLDRPSTVSALGRLNLPATQQNTLLLKWDILRENKIAIPSKSDLEDWYKNGVVDLAGFTAGMRERGYRDGDITRFARRIDQEVHEARQKELERAQKEQERLTASAQASDFAKRVAQVDVRIAEKKLSISNIKAALVQLPEEIDPLTLKQEIADLEVDIASLVVEKAEIKAAR